MFKNLRLSSPRAFAASALAIALFALPTPIGSPRIASAASAPALAYFSSQGTRVTFQGTGVLATGISQQPSLSAFNVQVDGARVDVVSLDFSLPLFLDLVLATTVFQGSTASVSYTAPSPVDNTLNNAALQTSGGSDVVSFSFTLDTATAAMRPSVPSTPTVEAGVESATITVTTTGSITPRSYLVTASPGGATCTVTGASGSCTITGLTAGTAYTFSAVGKRNGMGDSIQSPASASTTVLAKVTVPNTPGIPTVVAGPESATITVTPPTGGLTPTSYEVTATPGGATCTVTGASGSCTITGLTAGTAYTFTTVAKNASGSSSASTASASTTVLVKTAATAIATTSNAPSWDKEPATDSETDAFTEGYWPSTIPGNIIITDEFGFVVDAKNGIKPKIRMKNYSGKIKMSISATYKDGAKTKKYKCAFAAFGSTKKMKTAKWKWYTPKKACILPKPLVTAIQTGATTLSAKGKWARQWTTTAKKLRTDKTKIKPRTLKYTVRAKPAAIK